MASSGTGGSKNIADYQPFGEPRIYPTYDAGFHKTRYHITPNAPASKYFDGERLYIESDIIQNDDMVREWKIYARAAGAHIVEQYTTDVTIAVVKHRSTPTYQQASQDGKIVASLWWLTNTLLRQQIVPPTLTLIDYPMPKGGIPTRSHLVFAISGYRDTEKEYLRQLGMACGMIYSSGVSKEVTYLVSRNTGSNKVRVARQLLVFVVNHRWLEESYRDWQFHYPAEQKYINFEEGNDACRLGSITVDTNNATRWWDMNIPRPFEMPHAKKKWLDVSQQKESILPEKRGQSAQTPGSSKISQKKRKTKKNEKTK